MATADDDRVPRLPRGRGLTLSWPQIFRILMTLVVLILVIAMQQQCSHAVGKFVTSFDGSGSGSGHALGKPGTLDGPAAGSGRHVTAHTTAYVQLPTGLSDAEMRALIDRVRAEGPQLLNAPTPPPTPPPTTPPQPAPFPFDAMTP